MMKPRPVPGKADIDRALAILANPNAPEDLEVLAREVLTLAGVPIPKPVDPLARWNLLGIAALSEDLPPIPWVCEAIGLAPGAVTLVAGYGYSRKTMAMQSLGLAVAAGKPLWGVWSVRKGPFLHLDYEQGRRLTQERYQRLARGMGFELSSLPEGAMRVGVMPHAYLDEDKIFDELVTLVGDATLVLVDSLRAAFPRADENSSEVRTYLDVLSRVSERTGAAIAVIHHARKPSPTAGGTATHTIRGSSALFDACQSVYVFAGEKDTPTTVHHQKDRVRGVTLDDFGLMSDDVPGPSGPRHGLVVRHLEAEEMSEDSIRQDNEKRDAMVAKVGEAIIIALGRYGVDGFAGKRNEIRSLVRETVRFRSDTFDVAWRGLIDENVVVQSGTQRDPVWQLSVNVPHVPHRSPNVPQTSEGTFPIPPTP